MASKTSDRHNGPRHRGGAEEKANDSTYFRNKPGDVDSRGRHAMQPSSQAPTQYVSSRKGRHSHHSRTSRSRSRSPWRPDRNRSRSPYRARQSPSPSRSRSRSRSRSPFRHVQDRDRSPSGRGEHRGEKRSRGDDHYTKGSSDPRRFKTYYEGGISSASTPAYPSRESSKHAHRQRPLDSTSRTHNDSRSQDSTAKSRAKDSRRHFDRVGGSPLVTHATINGTEISTERGKGMSEGQQDTKLSGEITGETNVRSQSKVDLGLEIEPAAPRSDAEIIEERRKRRAELKARILREQAERNARPAADVTGGDPEFTRDSSQNDTIPVQHPVVQALKDSSLNSAPSTPITDSFAASEHASSPSVSMPATPNRDSTPASPATIVEYDPKDLANHERNESAVDEDEGPLAADYDPKKDMEEDQRRQTRAENHSEGTTLGTTKPAADDMFADNTDDDEDDMFAPGFAIGKSTKLDKPVDASMVEDLPDGHYRVVLGELLDHRYSIRQQIGKGMFGTVVRAEDSKTGQLVAIKIARNNDAMFKAGQQEIDMLTILNDNDADDKRHIIRLRGHFMHKKHLCLVFENLGSDLRETLKKYGRHRGINLTAIRSYAQQMFLALSHLKKCDVLHADVKPDNILVSESRGLIKICDLGTAVKADHFLESTPYLVSRFYRAPEVMLGIPFDYAIDMWSVGCTLFELYTGRILFTGADNNGMLRMIQECRGKIPIRLLKKSREVDRHFDNNANFISTEVDANTGKPMLKILPMNKTLPDKELRARLSSHMKNLSPQQQKEHMSFLDLMERCLQIDPAKRISPNDALRHPFVTGPVVARGSH